MLTRGLPKTLCLRRTLHALADDWVTVIGIETHVQLKTRAKLFSWGQAPTPSDEPNSLIAPFDIALPGTLPRLNHSAVHLGIRAALVLGSECQTISTFDRKHYFYADLPAGYQITQRYRPYALGTSNLLPWLYNTLILIQDTAKSLSVSGSLNLDFNRAGCALLEIVTDPDIRSPEDAVDYVKLLQRTLRSAEVTDGNMEDGSMRCDVNVSVHRKGCAEGTRCEVKNLNSLRGIAQAIRCEVLRHIDILNSGQAVAQETRGFDQDKVATYTLRMKEDAPDYRYMPDPNIPPLEITRIDSVKAQLPELPLQTFSRLKDLGLSSREIEVLLNADAAKSIKYDGETSSGAIAYFDEASVGRDPRIVANWITNEMLGQLAYRGLSFSNNPVSSAQLGGIIDLLGNGSLTGTSAKTLLRHLMDQPSNQDAFDAATQVGLVSGRPVPLNKICSWAISALPSEAEAVRAGNVGSVNRLVAYVMRETRGKADAAEARRELLEQLSRIV